MSEKIAVVLFNLGGPDKKESIKPFLFNFFMDKNIIAAPKPIRYFIAKLISMRRSKKEAGDSYDKLGGKSPLLDNTNQQAMALEQKLVDQGVAVKTFVSMRYWHPLGKDVLEQVKNYNPDKVVLLPLYPQFSTTTSFSSLEDWDKNTGAMKKKIGKKICCWPFNEGFIKASADNIKKVYADAEQPVRLLFSAHGLPEKIIEAGDPYQWQCEESAKAIAKEMGIENLDWEICYQSRVGPLKWIGPSTEEALHKAAQDKKGVIIYPHAFVSEHVETLVEIEDEYRELAEELGVPSFVRVPTVMTHPVFIDGLAQLVIDQLNGKEYERICPATFKRCGHSLMKESSLCKT